MANNESEGLASTVASHYNNLPRVELVDRTRSRIYHLRNFNNWTKSMLINEFVSKTNREISNFNVLDIGCGKGGDILKWFKARIDHLMLCDIAEHSVQEEAKDRYRELKHRNRGRVFDAHFITADCTRQRLLDLYPSKDHWFDIVSCQFAFHYCFESLQQADCMLNNVAERLKPGGHFIGTLPNAFDLVHRAALAKSNAFGNAIFSIELDKKMHEDHLSGAKPLPLFGAKYIFRLEGAVDCPEFLVHFPTLVALAEKHKLKLVSKENFENCFTKWKDSGRHLLHCMKALESYPPGHGESPKNSNYKFADEFLRQHPNIQCVGTLSQEEWDALTIYQIFAFEKMPD